MSLQVFVASVTSNTEIRKHVQRTLMVLEGLGVPFTPVDITKPGNEARRQFMRENAINENHAGPPLPPQFFFDDEYLGNYWDFEEAVEEDNLTEFLRLTPNNQDEIDAAIAARKAREKERKPPSPPPKEGKGHTGTDEAEGEGEEGEGEEGEAGDEGDEDAVDTAEATVSIKDKDMEVEKADVEKAESQEEKNEEKEEAKKEEKKEDPKKADAKEIVDEGEGEDEGEWEGEEEGE